MLISPTNHMFGLTHGPSWFMHLVRKSFMRDKVIDLFLKEMDLFREIHLAQSAGHFRK